MDFTAPRPIERLVLIDDVVEMRSATVEVYPVGTGPVLPSEVVVLPDGGERVTAEREVAARVTMRAAPVKKPAWATDMHWPEHGWTPLLVAARLKLAVETYRALSEPGIKPRGYVSC
ncbi:hypothetical protein, partial [Vineibacter terrae]|uniref:hypothetical protein n=1 Tax=Vineibacter terrae TaxID=2586908 RepID=UPI002E323570